MEIKMGPIMGKAPATVGMLGVKEGDTVKAGHILAQIETGKGNRPIKAPSNGRIVKILCQEDSKVQAGQCLFEFEETDAAGDELEKIKTGLFIIGSGPGGYVAAIYAARCGISSVLAEKKQLGGTCLNCGCIPTKALIQTAERYDEIRESESFGLNVTGCSQDPEKIFHRKDEICGELRTGIESLLQAAEVIVLKGAARFTGVHSAVVEKDGKCQEVEFEHAIIATGSGSMPLQTGKDASLIIDSETALSSGYFPGSITIIGGGVIGMEFAFMYQKMGTKVSVIEYASQILGNTDREAADLIREEAVRSGIAVYTDAKVIKVEQAESGEKIVTFEQQGIRHLLVSKAAMSAVGRKPVVTGLGLECAGIELTEKGAVKTNDLMQTNVGHIYAIGDATGKLMLAHMASRQGIVAVDAIRGIKNTADPEQIPAVIFTDPEVSSIGKMEKECEAEGIPFIVSRFPFSANGKAKIEGKTQGFVKLICHKETRHLLGGVVVGPDASALLSTIAVAVKAKMTDRELAQVVFAHPTTSEAIYEAVLGLSIGFLHYRK